MDYHNAGILPYAYFNNTVYFLLGREQDEVGWSGSNRLSDFGGAIEDENKTTTILNKFGATTSIADIARVTAAIEFWEETLGLFYSQVELYTMLKSQNGIVLGNNGYAEHLLKVDYSPYWVDLFRNANNFARTCAAQHPNGKYYIPSCPKGFIEKKEITWASYADVKKSIDADSPDYRVEFRGTLRKLFAMEAFKKHLAEASIFKDPTIVGFVAPVEPLPVLPLVAPASAPAPEDGTLKWPAFYPKKTEIIQPGLYTSIKSIYQNLLYSLPMVVKSPTFAAMFKYIDRINQLHMETKSFIYLKAVPGAKKTDAPIIPKLLWASAYCPLDDNSVAKSELGKGAYGSAFEIRGPPAVCCPDTRITFVAKVVNNTADKDQIAKLPANALEKSSTVFTNIFATEAASLSVCDQLVTRSVCYNLPHFYGVSECVPKGSFYMYMERFKTTLENADIEANDIDGIMLQAIMTFYALYGVHLVHGDINAQNVCFNILPEPKRPVYMVDGRYYIAPPTDLVLYLIDFGMGFIKDSYEPADRIEKDKGRFLNNINWGIATNLTEGAFTTHAYAAYKGYYLPPPGSHSKLSPNLTKKNIEDVAYVRRSLLDLYLFFAAMIGTVDPSNMTKYTDIRAHFMRLFANPVAIIKDPLNKDKTIAQLVDDYWTVGVVQALKNTGIQLMTPDELATSGIDPNTLMFLGNLDIDPLE